MALLPTLRKKYGQTNQSLSEKVGRVSNQVELDNEILAMEQRTDDFKKMIVDLDQKTEEYLQPDPKIRSKTAASEKRGTIGGRTPKTVDSRTLKGTLS